MPTTPKYGLPYPAGTDPNNVPADLQALGVAVENIVASQASGTAANRPAAGKAGRIYQATDTGVLSFDTGAAWIEFHGVARPFANVARSTDQNITGTATGLAYTKLVGMAALSAGNPAGVFNATSQRMTIPAGQAGWYTINGIIHWSNQVDGPTSVRVLINGTTGVLLDQIVSTAVYSTVTPALGGTRTVYLAAADYLELECRHLQGAEIKGVQVREWSLSWLRP